MKNIDNTASVIADDQQPDTKLPWVAPVVTEFSVSDVTMASGPITQGPDGAMYS